jgi:hypothetical protein
MAAPSIPHLEQLLGRALGRPARIASFERLSPWAVARVTLTDGSPATVMVKWVRDYDQRTDPRQIATEQAALIFLAELGFEAAPRLIAADADTLVMEDLAPRRPLAELLVERGMAACKPALMGWAQTLGQLGARTAAYAGRYGAIRAALGPDDPATAERGLGPGWTAVAQALDSLGARPSNAARQELAAIEAALRAPGPFAALTNGDVQANNLLVGDDLGNVRLIDYEAAAFRHALAAAVLIHTPGPAWITVADPFNLALEDAYRAALAEGIPEAADDAAFGSGLGGACLAWACDRLTRFRLLDARPAGDASRTQMISTLESAAAVARRHRQWPDAAGWAERTAERLRHRWPDADIDLAGLAPYTSRR